MSTAERGVRISQPHEQPEPRQFHRPQLLSEHVYDHLKSLILTNQLQPGEPLVEAAIATQWGVSRTPLRAALAQLERDGLVQSAPGKGRVVREILPADVRDVYQVREALEVTAVRLATPLIPADELTAMADRFAQIAAELNERRYDAYIPSDAEFHGLILRYVPNRLLVEMLGSIYNRTTRIRNFSHDRPGEHMRLAFSEHQQILDAIQRRDIEAASAGMSLHIRNVTERAISLLQPIMSEE
ncbi:MAG TPA: GntR family transcriptional regulator [Thermomicrobiales bacterium]|nr:GntR family transcriptional regulator [Thermomicrobiales bacterium]